MKESGILIVHIWQPFCRIKTLNEATDMLKLWVIDKHRPSRRAVFTVVYLTPYKSFRRPPPLITWATLVIELKNKH